ncbi:iron chelate uptake ABC transporter family permease subunit [Roseivirga sp. BDSF3-8]|uniref:metal ABC transporter permease n=1 Tax=Roseivirga sp. BDSF3-8 TaxID=3241598 RepID=UPI0035322D72
METLIEFLSFSDPNVRYVAIGTVLLGASSALVGTFTFLKKKALVGDAVAHAILPGICLSFMLTGVKNPVYLIIGASATGWLSLLLIDLIVRHSRIKEDAAIGLILSVFFGIGILLLTIIQQSGAAGQSGLDSFLFGQAAALVGQDVLVFGIVAGLLLLTILLFFKELELIAFDPQFAASSGVPVRFMDFLLTTLTVLAVVVGIQAVGVVLMAAMLITPAAAAKFWTDNIKVMALLAAIFGAFSGLAGAYISYTAPSMPTGPWTVIVLSTIALVSFFLSPVKGILPRMFRQRRNRLQMLEENILKTFYLLGEDAEDWKASRTSDEIRERRRYPKGTLIYILKRLVRHGYLRQIKNNYELTNVGFNKSRRVVRLHRLWELYLTQYLNIAPDHVHEDAETIEHVITPELEKRLMEKLDFPEKDPHSSKIPLS